MTTGSANTLQNLGFGKDGPKHGEGKATRSRSRTLLSQRKRSVHPLDHVAGQA